MSISSINDVIATTLRENGQSQYIGYAGPVVSQLIEREKTLAERLLVAASEQGFNVPEVRRTLTDLGMNVAPAVVDDSLPSEDDDEDLDLADQIRNLALSVNALITRVDSLGEFARANGYRG